MIIKFIYTYNTLLFKKILEIRRIQKRLKDKIRHLVQIVQMIEFKD